MSKKKPNRTPRTSRKRRNSRRTPEAEEQFLAALRAGKSIAGAAGAAGLGRRTVYDWRERDPAFLERWDEAWDEGTDRLEDLALRGAEEGSERLLLALLRARRPERYARTVVEHDGSLEVALRHASETLDQKLARLPQS
jgi:hypothetical protein